LNAAEIPVKVPLEAVGKNLGNHPSFTMRGFTVNDTSFFPRMESSLTEKILEEFHNGEGILTINPQGPQCFIASSNAEPSWPDLWIEMHPFTSVDDDEQRIYFYNVIGRPKSRGFLTMDTEKYKAGIRDDVELSLIDLQFLTHPDDVVAMLDGVKFIFKIIETDAFKSINLTYDAGPDSACSAFSYLTDDYWNCKIRRDTHAWHHMVGTNSLGPDSGDSSTSVVDTKFRVRGVSHLRIVDASVIPEVTNANLNAPVMMLAEKASEEIINLYKVPEPETTDATTEPNTEPTTTESNGASSIVIATMNVLLFIALMFTFCI